MADQNRDESDRSQRAETIGDESTSNSPTTQRDQKDQNRDRSEKAGSRDQNPEQDDVAEDRNLSGSSTWLTLPDQQPANDDEAGNS